MNVSRKLALTLRRGTVYMMQHRDLKSADAHFLIVLNHDPCADQVIVLSVVTSKVEKRRERIRMQGYPMETLVEIAVSEYSELRIDSAVDCNSALTMNADEFEHDSKMSKACVDMPPEICDKIVTGVLSSPEVSAAIKKLLRPVEAP